MRCRKQLPPDQGRILVLLKTFLGDAVMATPLLDGLLQRGFQVTIATSSLIRDLLSSPSRNFGFFEVERSRKLSDTYRMGQGMAGLGFDAAIVVNRSFRSAVAAAVAKIPTRSGHGTDFRGILLTHTLRYDLMRNEAECYLDLARLIGIDLPLRESALHLSESERAAGANRVEPGTIAIQPGASFSGKRIPISHLKKLTEELRSLGHPVVLLGGKDEERAAQELLQALDEPVPSLVGQTAIRESMGILASVRAFVSGDTGLCHVAAGVGCPTLVVFSGQPASKWAHDYWPHRFLIAPGGDMRRLTYEALWDSLQESLRNSVTRVPGPL